jgi:hypothetical protein
MMNRLSGMVLVVAGALSGFGLGQSSTEAQDGDAVEGAIWRFTITRVAGKQERHGRFRILGTEIFQRRMGEEDVVVGTIEGKFEPPRNEVVVNFTKLQSRGAQPIALKGRLKRTDAGVAEGRLVDGNGFHWQFKAERIIE